MASSYGNNLSSFQSRFQNCFASFVFYLLIHMLFSLSLVYLWGPLSFSVLNNCCFYVCWFITFVIFVTFLGPLPLSVFNKHMLYLWLSLAWFDTFVTFVIFVDFFLFVRARSLVRLQELLFLLLSFASFVTFALFVIFVIVVIKLWALLAFSVVSILFLFL